MSIVRAATAPRFDVPGIEFVGLASPSRGSAGLCTWRATVEPRLQSTAHTLDRDEVFMVVSGRVSVTPGGPVLGAGDAAVVPAGERIRLDNATDEPAELIVAVTAGVRASMVDGTVVGTPPWAQ